MPHPANKCQTPPKRQTEKWQTPGTEWCILALKSVTSDGNNFNYFRDNKLTKFHVFIG